MDYFHRSGTSLHCEEVPLADIAAAVGTPTYVYSRRTMELHVRRLREAFAGADPLICYAMKANGTLAVLDLMRRLGTGFDVVSGGELFRVLRAGGDPSKVVFAGVGKTRAEMEQALDAGILFFNVESAGELELLDAVGRDRGVAAPVALRVNPDVDPKTHAYISTGKRESKFGIDLEQAAVLAERMRTMTGVRLIAIHAHIGSQITEVAPMVATLRKTVEFAAAARAMGHPVEWLNMGGGFGIFYRGGEAPAASEFGAAIVPLVKEAGLRLVMEPGRFIVGNAGVLLTRVLYVKESGERRFVIVDAAMNDLLRPSLYGAHHRIWPVECDLAEEDAAAHPSRLVTCDVVGPVCESGDFLAKDRPLPSGSAGDLMCVFSAGAYGMVMAGNYNSRPRAAEVLVDGDRFDVVRTRETLEDLVRGETIPAGS